MIVALSDNGSGDISIREVIKSLTLVYVYFS